MEELTYVGISPEDYELILRERSIHSRSRRMQRTGIPHVYWNSTFENFERRSATAEIRKAARYYAEHFSDDPPMHGGRGFTVVGPPGVGKTMLSCLVGVQLADEGMYVRFIPMAKYIGLLQRQISLQQAWQTYEDITSFEEWQRNDDYLYALTNVAHLVILDDVGKEYRSKSGYAADAFDAFLRDRVNLGRPVIVTSNVPLKDWTGEYSEAMRSFIHQAGEVFTIGETDDMRRKDED